ncbi:MAG TPA: hypothetical protein D7I06_01025 [Candidatus Poseidoniales archaeon]|jgi:hypothetical protein|nr:hypothetical protein [Pseudomonadota bacterium]DAC18870.1 MAG TPA: hypothetical protein D7I06_01025 [Candidatus Poseidoniales archaeon]HII62170.1 hypothetical protein [Candidatus Poseidoniaceae archaeon]|tara:strand:- start:561 stop:887 length:327 start_codon:yes stop_codon:yes gene_type:complete
MADVNVFDEHGGIFHIDTGTALITFWPQQIETNENSDVVIRPISVQLRLDDSDKQKVSKFASPKDTRYFKDKARSSITDIAYSNLAKEEKSMLLNELKKEITNLEKNL